MSIVGLGGGDVVNIIGVKVVWVVLVIFRVLDLYRIGGGVGLVWVLILFFILN